MSRPKTTVPQHIGMLEVTSKNRRSLEREYGINIPEDVRFIIPTEVLYEQLSDDLFWDKVRELRRNDPRRLDKPAIS